MAGTVREPLVQLPQQLSEITVARLRCRGLEGAAERGGDAGVSGRNGHTDDLTVHAVQFRLQFML